MKVYSYCVYILIVTSKNKKIHENVSYIVGPIINTK